MHSGGISALSVHQWLSIDVVAPYRAISLLWPVPPVVVHLVVFAVPKSQIAWSLSLHKTTLETYATILKSPMTSQPHSFKAASWRLLIMW